VYGAPPNGCAKEESRHIRVAVVPALEPQVMQAISEHDPEKWTPVFGKDHAQIKKLDFDPIQSNRIKA
jgi:hypothetical protein